MVNRVILIGNLGKDPEVRRLENGASVAKFSIATNESYRDKNGQWQEMTEWHDIVAWRALAERAESSLKKGTTIYVEGKLTHRTWQDQDGNNRRTTEVVASYFRIINARRDDTATASDARPASAHDFPSSEEPSPIEINDGAADDDLPF